MLSLISSAPFEGTINIATRISSSPFKQALNATPSYFNRTSEIPFEEELQKLSEEHPEFQMKIVIGELITAERILELAPGANKETVFLSGPAPVVSSIGTVLKERGVSIKQDRFPGYDETNF